MRNVCLRDGLRGRLLVVAAGVAIGVLAAPGYAQNESLGQDAGTCKLKDHIYACDGAKFHEALLSAETVAVDAHNWDGVARGQLKDLVTNKLGKRVVEPSTQPDLIFFLVPVEGTGVISTTDVDLGTFRVYTSTSDGARGHLLWAETYSGPQVPWPAVVRGLIRQFEAHFQIK